MTHQTQAPRVIIVLKGQVLRGWSWFCQSAFNMYKRKLGLSVRQVRKTDTFETFVEGNSVGSVIEWLETRTCNSEAPGSSLSL